MNKVFEDYKNSHTGQRVFLIGNGPSLSSKDLDLIEGEISFAMNRIPLLYDSTSWRPTYYLFSSTNVRPDKPWSNKWQLSVRAAMSDKNTTSFISNDFRQNIDPFGEFPHVKWFMTMSERKPNLQGEVDISCFSTDVVERIDKTGTTMNLALQLALYMNFSEIIFLGCDLGWSKDTGTENDPNHFDKDYVAEILRPEKTNNQMRNIHSLALKCFQESGKEVNFYNCTRDTVLDVYPLINFDDYITSGKIVYRNEELEEAKKYWNKKPQYANLVY